VTPEIMLSTSVALFIVIVTIIRALHTGLEGNTWQGERGFKRGFKRGKCKRSA
jgi:hypothetical protein